MLLFGLCSGLLPLAPLPQSPAPFTEEAGARNVQYFTFHGLGAGRGVALVDLDGDDDPDIVALGRVDGVVGFWENDGNGVFIEHTDTTGLAPIPGAVGLAAADVDGDGDVDVYISGWETANALLRNEGDFQFTNIGTAAGVDDLGRGSGCAMADVDLDGLVDIYASNNTPFTAPIPNRLFHNLGSNQFQDIAAAQGVASDDFTWQAVFFDYDRDADADLYVSNDKGQATCGEHNFLYRNDGGSFVDVSVGSGADICIDSMGVAVGDFDGNLYQDLYCTNTPSGNALLLNQGDGTFVEATAAAGLGSFLTGWGAVFFDWDNDGNQDLFVCNQDGPSRFYENDGSANWPCADIAPALGVDLSNNTYCAAAADIDADGDLDLLVQRINQPLKLFINHEGERRNWSRLIVEGSGNNTSAIGARIDILAGGKWQTREVLSGTGFKSQDDFALHFGLDAATTLDAMLVTWPGGARRMLLGYPAGATWKIPPPARLGDGNGDGVVGIFDFYSFAGHFGGPFRSGSEVMDFDGDADVDRSDFFAFLLVYTGPRLDCNTNGVLDLKEILLGTATDADRDGVLDACEK